MPLNQSHLAAADGSGLGRCCPSARSRGCGGDDDGTSPASLTGELLPASEIPGFKVVREFEWDNPIDFVVEGLHLPEATPPSDAVEAFENAGFDAAAGEFLVKGEPFQGPGAAVDVVQLGSDDDAREALDYVRSEALKQPCFAVCSVEGREFSVAGIPGAEGVELTPLPDPPPDAPPPFEGFSVGFTDGSAPLPGERGWRARTGQEERGAQRGQGALRARHERRRVVAKPTRRSLRPALRPRSGPPPAPDASPPRPRGSWAERTWCSPSSKRLVATATSSTARSNVSAFA